ncbi:MAG: DUF4065 domain-containing protein [Prevotellaceae bacterium]|nr:DUF4065 domain-containing protein [Prevotellaceae bacterium]
MAYNVLDIANELLLYAENSEGGEDLMSNMKLQKMLYYQQGFHLAYFDTPLFDEEIEAWTYGPVVLSVYEHYKKYGRTGIAPDRNRAFHFNDKREEALFDEVYKVYGKYSAWGLKDMTHAEAPWRSTPTGDGNVISKEKMKDFFKSRLQR